MPAATPPCRSRSGCAARPRGITTIERIRFKSLQSRITARADWFETSDNSFVATDDNNEEGWAATLAYRRPLVEFADIVVEVLHVSSDRPARVSNAGIAAEQDQTMVQTSLRLHL